MINGYGYCYGYGYDTTLMIIYGGFYSHEGTPRTLDVFFLEHTMKIWMIWGYP